MRLMMKFTIPVGLGNETAKDGTQMQAIESLLKATNAEAAYFTMIDGERGGYNQARTSELALHR
jgi:hypothetical protein